MMTKTTKRGRRIDHWQIGERYYIQTVTHYYVGTLVAVNEHELILCDVAWVADSGRHHAFVAGEKASEIEAWPKGAKVILGRGALIAASRSSHVAETI